MRHKTKNALHSSDTTLRVLIFATTTQTFPHNMRL